MTDLEKWQSLLKDTGIPFETEYDRLGDGNPAIEIGYTEDGTPADNYNDIFGGDLYCPGLVIYFNSDGSFMHFVPSGE